MSIKIRRVERRRVLVVAVVVSEVSHVGRHLCLYSTATTQSLIRLVLNCRLSGIYRCQQCQSMHFRRLQLHHLYTHISSQTQTQTRIKAGPSLSPSGLFNGLEAVLGTEVEEGEGESPLPSE
jgi:hypothetical protein